MSILITIFKNFYTKKEDKVCADCLEQGTVYRRYFVFKSATNFVFLFGGKFFGRVRETFFSKKVSRKNINSSMPASGQGYVRLWR